MAAQQESEAISGNLRWGIRKRMASGEYICSHVAYGYTLVDGQMVVCEPEAAVVRRIFQLYLQGMGMQSIASLFNEEGVPRRRGYRVWLRTAVQYILTNEKYIGDALMQKHYTTDTLPYKSKRNHGEKTMYYVENYNPPIVTKEIFNAVQDLLKTRQGEQRERAVYPLSQIMKCPDCGRTFRRQIIQEKAYWCCSNWAAGSGNCMSRRVREDMVYDTFINMVYKLITNRQGLLGPLIQWLEYLQSKTSENHDKIRQIDKEIADLSAKNLVVTRLHTSGILGVSEYTAQTSEIGNRLTELRIERRKKLAEDENDVLLDDLKSLNEILQEYRPNGRFDADFFAQIVDKITVDDSTQLTFHLIGNLRLTEPIKEKGRCKTA